MKYIDISWPLTADVTTYKDRGDVSCTFEKTFERDGVRSSSIAFGTHTGTHIDAPAHFLRDGAFIESIALEQLCGRCKVIDLTGLEKNITRTDLEQHSISAGDRILLKTRNSARLATGPFDPNFIYLEQSGAQFLAECGVAAVGIDYLGIERNQPQHETHCLLLEKNIPIIEGLRLDGVAPGSYELICLPLALRGTEAAPARAVLRADCPS